MTTAAVSGTPSATGRHRRPHREPARRLVRIAAALGVAGLAVLVVLHELGFRGWEAWIAGHVTALVTSTPTVIYRATFYVDTGSPDGFGLRVTGECTAALVVVGLLGVTAVLAAATTLPLHRLAVAAVVASAAFYIVNLIRLVVIAVSTRQWGLDRGFYWSHIWAGTFVTVIGAAVALAIYLFTLGGVGRRQRKAGHTQ